MTLLVAAGCTPVAKEPQTQEREGTSERALAFLRGRLQPWEGGVLAVTDVRTGRMAIYDSALTALVLLRSNHRDEAGRVLVGLGRVQGTDGSLPFSFSHASFEAGKDPAYVRSGALAWVGYAAVEYLDAAPGGEARDVAIVLARRIAAFVLSRQVSDRADPRDGLVLGGRGSFSYELDAQGEAIERFHAGDVAWASVEHNIDSYFFLRALARVTGETSYRDAAERIAIGLARGWDARAGQLHRGMSARGGDETLALDCASWGALFFAAKGDIVRARTAAYHADVDYASHDPRSGALGHRVYARGPIFESATLAHSLSRRLPATHWEALDAVWPEGSAGVAMATLRVGKPERARAIIGALEPLRRTDGSLPTHTIEIPFELDTGPSVAGTAWVELVRYELTRPAGKPTFWL